MLGFAAGDLGLDAKPTQKGSGPVVVIAAVGVDFIGKFFGTAGFAADFGKLQDDRNEFNLIAGVGGHQG